jgi:hypothetical protein
VVSTSGKCVREQGTHFALRNLHHRSDSLFKRVETTWGDVGGVSAGGYVGATTTLLEGRAKETPHGESFSVDVAKCAVMCQETTRARCAPASQSKRLSFSNTLSTLLMSSQVARFVGGMCGRSSGRAPPSAKGVGSGASETLGKVRKNWNLRRFKFSLVNRLSNPVLEARKRTKRTGEQEGHDRGQEGQDIRALLKYIPDRSAKRGPPLNAKCCD